MCWNETQFRYSLMYVSRGPERWTPVLKMTLVGRDSAVPGRQRDTDRNLRYISNLLDFDSFHTVFTISQLKLTICCCRLTLRAPSFLAQGLLWMPQQGLVTEACPVPIHVQPERNYGEIPSCLSLEQMFHGISHSSFLRSCWISCQLPIVMASFRNRFLLLAFSLHLLPVADWAIGLNSSLVFSSFLYSHPCWYSCGQIILFHTMIFQLGYLTWFGQGFVSRTMT